MPTPLELLNGTHADTYGYKPLYLERLPGQSFSYSGGGFIVLQLILESLENNTIQHITRHFLDSCGLDEFTFHLGNLENKRYATG